MHSSAQRLMRYSAEIEVRLAKSMEATFHPWLTLLKSIHTPARTGASSLASLNSREHDKSRRMRLNLEEK